MKLLQTINASFLTVLVFYCFSCKKENLLTISCDKKSNSIDIARKFLSSTYTWVYTEVSYQGGGTIETPINTDINYKYVFNANGKVYYYENDSLKSTDNYVIDYEFKVTTFPSDSATIVIINDVITGQRKDFFRTFLCSDSALFYNPYNSIDYKRYFKRN